MSSIGVSLITLYNLCIPVRQFCPTFCWYLYLLECEDCDYKIKWKYVIIKKIKKKIEKQGRGCVRDVGRREARMKSHAVLLNLHHEMHEICSCYIHFFKDSNSIWTWVTNIYIFIEQYWWKDANSLQWKTSKSNFSK